MGAPLGNQNARKAGEWAAALRAELAEYQDGTVGIERGTALRHIAKKILSQALNGEYPAITEIGNRLDGKPHQAVAMEGGDGGPLEMLVRFVAAAIKENP